MRNALEASAMRRALLTACTLLLTGCSALSASLVLGTDATSFPWESTPAYGPVRCEECDAARTEADALADRVPEWMEQSRAQAGPDATVTRTGFFSWEVSSPRVVATCTVIVKRWRCDRELAAAFSQQL
jgi:hypothetical protein